MLKGIKLDKKKKVIIGGVVIVLLLAGAGITYAVANSNSDTGKKEVKGTVSTEKAKEEQPTADDKAVTVADENNSGSDSSNTNADSNTTSGNSKKGSSSSNSSGSSNSGSGSQASTPSHSHNWTPVYGTKTVTDYETKCITKCSACHADITGNVTAHVKEEALAGNNGGSYQEYEQVAVGTHTEQYLTGYKCSCGATK